MHFLRLGVVFPERLEGGRGRIDQVLYEREGAHDDEGRAEDEFQGAVGEEGREGGH